jgi:hypothetical protein
MVEKATIGQCGILERGQCKGISRTGGEQGKRKCMVVREREARLI